MREAEREGPDGMRPSSGPRAGRVHPSGVQVGVPTEHVTNISQEAHHITGDNRAQLLPTSSLPAWDALYPEAVTRLPLAGAADSSHDSPCTLRETAGTGCFQKPGGQPGVY